MTTNNESNSDALGLILLGSGLVLLGILAGWLLRQPSVVAVRIPNGTRIDAEQIDEMEYALAMAPLDDEAESPEEAAAVAASRAERDRGEIIPWSQVRADARLRV